MDEVLAVDPAERAIHWLGLDDGEYRPVESSRLVALGRGELATLIHWP